MSYYKSYQKSDKVSFLWILQVICQKKMEVHEIPSSHKKKIKTFFSTWKPNKAKKTFVILIELWRLNKSFKTLNQIYLRDYCLEHLITKKFIEFWTVCSMTFVKKVRLNMETHFISKVRLFLKKLDKKNRKDF